MIQILMTKISKFKKNQFIVQFFISIFGILIIFFCYFSYKIKLNSQEELSKSLAKSYKISKLYSNNNSNYSFNDSDILGTINIPKINLSYTFFAGLTDDLLKISPCRFSGNMPKDEKGNLCIAGHNYNDNRFFSKINLLNYGDKIIISDNNKNEFIYSVYDKYEVKENDFSPITSYDKNSYELTLVTCNNFNNNRIIIKSKTESPY